MRAYRPYSGAAVVIPDPTVPVPPSGFLFLLGADGAYLLGADGAYLVGAA